MVLQQAIERLKTLFSSQHQKKLQFLNLEEKLKYAKVEAVLATQRIVLEIREQSKTLKYAVSSVAKKPVDQGISFYKIAVEHQRSFASRLEPLCKELENLKFSSDYDALLEDQKRLADVLTSINRVVFGDRYVYAFFEKELQEFNQAMKRLLELNEAFAEALRPAYFLSLQCKTLEERKSEIASISQRVEFLQAQKERSSNLIRQYVAEIDLLKNQFNEKEFDRTKTMLEQAVIAEKTAENPFYSFLDSVEGVLKKYARGKQRGRFAFVAERYLHNKKAFLEDCFEGKQELYSLLDDLELTAFKQRCNELTGALQKARSERARLDAELENLEEPKIKLTSFESNLKSANGELDSLEKKIASLAEDAKMKEAALEEEEKLIIAG